MNKTSINKYLTEIESINATGKATEISFYPALNTLIKGMGGKSIQIITDAKKQEAGKPDFTILAEDGDTIGYIEAKTLGADLKQLEKTKQIKTYIATFPNFIFTNFHEFRLYSKGTLVSQTYLQDYGLIEDVTKTRAADFTKMLNRFLSKTTPVETEVKIIAELLATITKDTLNPAIEEQLKSEIIKESGELYGAYTDFKENLLHDLTNEQFVDMYAQTITYGLLTAKMNHVSGEFNRDTSVRDIPKEFGVLHSVFKFIATDNLPVEIEAAIDDIVDVLNRTDPASVMTRYYSEERGKEWFIHFYETFLDKYNPGERRSRGVYYTPDSVVSYITRSVNHVLKDSFGKACGFGNEDVEVLDPATGTLSFLSSACQIAIDEKIDADGDGTINEFIHDHVLKHFYGYELMMTPYALAHLKMKSLLDKNNYSLDIPRSRIFLVNALDTKRPSDPDIHIYSDIGRSVSNEAMCAYKVSTRNEIIAVIGNPPYSRISSNKDNFKDEIGIYKESIKDESVTMAISDDYVKFIRLAHERVDNKGEGVVGIITNNSYLSGLIYRGMREELMKSFDEIHILNLHGHAGVDPKGDKNVFDIKQGVSIAILVKHKDNEEHKPSKKCKVYHSELIGSRKYKYDYLDSHSIKDMEWSELEPTEPYYFFEPKDWSGKETYDGFVSISDIFNKRSTGIITSKDDITIQKNKAEMKKIVREFSTLDENEVRSIYKLPEKTDTNNWNVSDAMSDVKRMVSFGDDITRICYRPFDTRYTYYPDKTVYKKKTRNSKKECRFMHSQSRDIMKHLMHDNMAFVGMRQYLYDVYSYNYVFVSDNITDSRIFVSNRGGGSIMPLYLYSDECSKKSNIDPTIMTNITKAYHIVVTPEDIFYYIYGILHSNTYRQKYAELLKIDFPKIPFTTNHDMFMQVGAIGKQLADIHLMKPDVFNHSIIEYHGSGENRIDKVSYDESTQRVYINKTQYFDMIPLEVWNCQIGGYRPAKKWLDDRKHDVLTSDDIDHYRYIGHALEKTMELQEEIDMMYDDIDKDVIIW